MTNPDSVIGTNAAYGARTSTKAFNDILQLVNGRGILSGWEVVPSGGMNIEVGGIAGVRDVAVAEDNLGNRTTINNRLETPVSITVAAASVSSNRYDAVVAYVNNPAQASDTTPDAPTTCGVIEVQGGSTGVSDAQIRAAITADGGTGSIAYYVVLATVYVAAGTTTITSTNISQKHIAISASDIAQGEITAGMIDWSSFGCIESSFYFENKSNGDTVDITTNKGTKLKVAFISHGAPYIVSGAGSVKMVEIRTAARLAATRNDGYAIVGIGSGATVYTRAYEQFANGTGSATEIVKNQSWSGTAGGITVYGGDFASVGNGSKTSFLSEYTILKSGSGDTSLFGKAGSGGSNTSISFEAQISAVPDAGFPGIFLGNATSSTNFSFIKVYESAN